MTVLFGRCRNRPIRLYTYTLTFPGVFKRENQPCGYVYYGEPVI